ncbi:hypothetical protein CUMW_245000 [Citrus unshiu]|nr:hypothetical protein CUMW_245000 [Citrus unshiu]
MAELHRHTSHDNNSVHSREPKQPNQDSKLEFSEDEETLIAKMWSLIAGRIPGRTAEEIKKYWTSRYSSTNE